MGPLYVRTPEPGNVLLVEILAMEMDSWGWTADFHVRITGRRVRGAVEILPSLRAPLCPFTGTMGRPFHYIHNRLTQVTGIGP